MWNAELNRGEDDAAGRLLQSVAREISCWIALGGALSASVQTRRRSMIQGQTGDILTEF